MIFDPASEFLNFLYLVYLLYCYFTVIYENPDCSFYLPVSMCRVLTVGAKLKWRSELKVSFPAAFVVVGVKGAPMPVLEELVGANSVRKI
jgi:hypothetical protein